MNQTPVKQGLFTLGCLRVMRERFLHTPAFLTFSCLLLYKNRARHNYFRCLTSNMPNNYGLEIIVRVFGLSRLSLTLVGCLLLFFGKYANGAK